VNLPPLTGQLTGSALILFYELSWDQGSNGASWTTYTVTSNSQVLFTSLTSGQQYKFRYRGQNVNGWGPYSPVLTIVAMVVPFQVPSVVTTYYQTSVKIDWTAPYTGGQGIPITSYDILIAKADGSYIRYLPNCDGNSSIVISNTYCLVAMSDITGSTFGLA